MSFDKNEIKIKIDKAFDCRPYIVILIIFIVFPFFAKVIENEDFNLVKTLFNCHFYYSFALFFISGYKEYLGDKILRIYFYDEKLYQAEHSMNYDINIDYRAPSSFWEMKSSKDRMFINKRMKEVIFNSEKYDSMLVYYYKNYSNFHDLFMGFFIYGNIFLWILYKIAT